MFDFAHLRNKIDIAWHRNLLKFFENSKNSTELHLGSFHPYYIHAICFKYQSIRPWWPLQPPVATRRAVKAIQHIVDDRSARWTGNNYVQIIMNKCQYAKFKVAKKRQLILSAIEMLFQKMSWTPLKSSNQRNENIPDSLVWYWDTQFRVYALFFIKIHWYKHDELIILSI